MKGQLLVFLIVLLVLSAFAPAYGQEDSTEIDSCLDVEARLLDVVDSLKQQGFDTLLTVFYYDLNNPLEERDHWSPINKKGYVFAQKPDESLLIRMAAATRLNTPTTSATASILIISSSTANESCERN